MLDGSWGVLIQRDVRGEEAYRGERFHDHPRDVAGDPDPLNLTRPEVVLGIHRDYFAAGADIATTNTFTATTIGQADDALEDAAYEMSVEERAWRMQAADELGRPAWVAGSIGPLNVSLSVSPRVDDPTFRSHTFDQVVETYASQIRALVEGGLDLLLIETDLRHAEREGRRRGRARRRARRSALDLVHRDRQERPQPRARRSRHSGRRSSMRSRSSSASTARSARPRCGHSSKGCRGSPTPTSPVIRTPGRRTRWGCGTTSSATTRACSCGSCGWTGS